MTVEGHHVQHDGRVRIWDRSRKCWLSRMPIDAREMLKFGGGQFSMSADDVKFVPGEAVEVAPAIPLQPIQLLDIPEEQPKPEEEPADPPAAAEALLFDEAE